ncbi:MAG TPA: hypothetical protein VMV97_08130 [Sulfuriferula sp.]|nr:hypothetical protein [Sulfuriferula sp.]
MRHTLGLMKAGFYCVCGQIALALLLQAVENTTGLSTVPRNKRLTYPVTNTWTLMDRASRKQASAGMPIALITAKGNHYESAAI